MAKTAAVILTDRFEPVEALGTVDVLRRGGVDVTTVSIMGVPQVLSAADILVTADDMIEETDLLGFDMLIVPGGSGTDNYLTCKPLVDALKAFMAEDRLVGAICAGPSALGKMGVIGNHKSTCYPGLEVNLPAGAYLGNGVFTDGNFVTGSGPGYSLHFGIECLKALCGADVAQQVSKDMLLS